MSQPQDPCLTPTDSNYYPSPAESFLQSDPGTAFTSIFDTFDHEWQAMCSPMQTSPNDAMPVHEPLPCDSMQFESVGDWFTDEPLINDESGLAGALFPALDDPTSHHLPFSAPSVAGAPKPLSYPQAPLTASPRDVYLEPPLSPAVAPYVAVAQLRQPHLSSPTLADPFPVNLSNISTYDDVGPVDAFIKAELPSPPHSPTYADDKLLAGRSGRLADTIKHRRLPRIPDGYPCSHEGCDRCFATRSDLNHHAQYHRPADLMCSIAGCGSRFPVKSQLRRHLETVHVDGDARKYHCDACDVHTSRHDVYKRHIKTKKHEKRVATQVQIHQ